MTAGELWTRVQLDIFSDRRLGRRGRWIVYSALIGLASGIGAILFDQLFHLAQSLLLGGLGQFVPPGSGIEGGAGSPPQSRWLLPLSLVVGGLLSGWLVYGLAPESEGHGTDAVLTAFHRGRGAIRRRVPLVKALASAITIGSGGSAGREGPIAQVGAGIGSAMGDLLGLSHHDRRILMMAGAAGGIGSIFRAPFGAALFSAEALYSKPEFEYEVLLPGLISAITGYSVYSSYAGWGYLFTVPPISFHQPRQLLLYLLLGVVCALFGRIYPRIFYGVRDRIFRPLRVPRWSKPAIGAAALGLIALGFPEALGMGYGYVQHAIDGRYGIAFLLGFALIKMIATSLTISSGGSGGVFGPSLVIGGAIGAAFGQTAALLAPGLAPEPAACVLVGMGGVFAGVAKTPFAAVIMVTEMTGSYGLLVPSLLVATIAYLVVPLRVTLYENQVPSRPDSPAHSGSFAMHVLRRTRIRDLIGERAAIPQTASPHTPVERVVEIADGSAQNLVPVTDGDGRLLGEIAADAARQAVDAGAGSDPVERSMLRRVSFVTPMDTLATAARLLTGRTTDSVVVVRSRADRRVAGLFTRRELILAYAREMERLREGDGDEPLPDREPF